MEKSVDLFVEVAARREPTGEPRDLLALPTLSVSLLALLVEYSNSDLYGRLEEITELVSSELGVDFLGRMFNLKKLVL
jgi:hypothetical protein